MATELTSPQNPRIKSVLKLTKRRDRDRERITVVEGGREVLRALEAGVAPSEAFVCPALRRTPESVAALARLEALDAARKTHLFLVPPELFAKLAYRDDSDGVLAVVPYLDTAPTTLPLGTPPFLALIEGAEKPGNLGTILRSADAAGADGVMVCHAPGQTATDVHNPNVVRASLGKLFAVPVAEALTHDALAWLHENNIALVAATPEATVPFTAVDMTGPVAVAMGSEADGLSPTLLAAADVRVRIPMFGRADSLNLATSTALLLYEVVRQRMAAGLMRDDVHPT